LSKEVYMSDLSFLELVAAWEMFVDRHLASAEWLAESRFIFQNDLENLTFKNLLLAMVKPPPGISPQVAEKLRIRNCEEVETVGRQSRQLSRKQFMEILALAKGKSIELGREFPRFLEDRASQSDAAALNLTKPDDMVERDSRPTLPVPIPDEALLERCRSSEPPTIMPPAAYPEVVGLEADLVPSRRYSSDPSEISIGDSEEVDIDNLEEKL